MKDIEQLQGTQDITDPGTQAADERSRRFLLGNEGAQDGGHGNENQKNNGQLHGREKGPDLIFFRQNR
jgi:hypothetical protein